jgi:hypothetical protein
MRSSMLERIARAEPATTPHTAPTVMSLGGSQLRCRRRRKQLADSPVNAYRLQSPYISAHSIRSLHSPVSLIASTIPTSPCTTLSRDNKLRSPSLERCSADGFWTSLSSTQRCTEPARYTLRDSCLITKSVPRGSIHKMTHPPYH